MTLPTNPRRITGDQHAATPKTDQPPAEWPVWALKVRERYEGQLAEKDRRIAELEDAIVAAKKAERHLNESKYQMALYGGQANFNDALAMVKKSPKYKDLNDAEHNYVTAVALATGLHPEWGLHAWKQDSKLVISPDYKSLFALAIKDYHVTKDRRLTADEMKARGIPQQDIDEGSIAYEVQVIDLQKAILCKNAGVEYPPITGYGWWAAKKDETEWVATGEKKPDGSDKKKKQLTGKRVDNDVANGRDGAWMAWKAAARDALNKIADFRLKYAPIQGAVIEDGDYVFKAPGPVIEGTIIPQDDQPETES
jgi:hypothetical protein